VRPWTGTGRLQYSSPHHIGPRLLQLPHAAAFVDPLFSSGMSVLTVAIDLIAETLLGALGDDAFDVERFRPIEEVVNEGFDHYDLIVSRSFDAFADRDLWNAWNRNWVMGNFLGTFGPLALLVNSLATGDRSILAKTTERSRIGVLSSHLPEVRALMYASAGDVDAATDGRATPAESAARIFARLGAADFVPPYMGFGDPTQQAPATFTLQAGARHVLWYRRQPERWRAYADFPLTTYARLALGFAGAGIFDGLRRGWATARDVFSADNGEWRRAPSALVAAEGWELAPPAPDAPAPAVALAE
jgi:FADH2 O2-dependent halogenase